MEQRTRAGSLEASAIGLDCMGKSHGYGPPGKFGFDLHGGIEDVFGTGQEAHRGGQPARST